jgi:tripartite-type tricarboxylate transporter receptor subunit TctC
VTPLRLLPLLVPLLAALPTPGAADSFPSRQVTIVSPYQAGGTSDIIARALAQRLSALWSQPVVVENRPGANGAIGVQTIARAPADGHMLLATASSALTLNPLIYPNLGYDVKRDLAPVSRTGEVPNVLVVNPAVAARTVSELVALAKASPGRLTYASQGIGSNGQLNGELFMMRTGAELLHVPYKGSAPAVTDLVGGQVQVMFDNLPSVIEQVRAGTLRALAVTSATRSPQLPDVPTMAEAGVAGFDTTAWFAVLVAAKTPDDLRAKIEAAVAAALRDPELRQKLAQAGVEVVGAGAADLAGKIEADAQMWKGVVEKAQIKVQ